MGTSASISADPGRPKPTPGRRRHSTEIRQARTDLWIEKDLKPALQQMQAGKFREALEKLADIRGRVARHSMTNKHIHLYKLTVLCADCHKALGQSKDALKLYLDARKRTPITASGKEIDHVGNSIIELQTQKLESKHRVKSKLKVDTSKIANTIRTQSGRDVAISPPVIFQLGNAVGSQNTAWQQ